MKVVEIKQVKKILIPYMVLLLTAIVVGNVYMFTSLQYSDRSWLKVIQLGVSAYVIFLIYRSWKSLKKDEPVITISPQSITYHKGPVPRSFHWHDITGVQLIKKNEEPYLMLNTAGEEKEIPLSWLDKNPEMIMALIDEYKSTNTK